MSTLSSALESLEREFRKLREEIADALTLEALQFREADQLRLAHGRLEGERDELVAHGEIRTGSVALKQLDRSFATLLQREAVHRQKRRRVSTQLRILRERLRLAVSKLDGLIRGT